MDLAYLYCTNSECFYYTIYSGLQYGDSLVLLCIYHPIDRDRRKHDERVVRDQLGVGRLTVYGDADRNMYQCGGSCYMGYQ